MSFFSKPAVTPLTILASRARMVPDMALACFDSFVALTSSLPPSCSTEIPETRKCRSVPRGPLTDTSEGVRTTSTFAGTGTGFLPTRDIFISLRYDTQYFTTYSAGPCLALGHHPLRRRDNCNSEAIHDLRKFILRLVNAQTGAADTLDFFNYRSSGIILQADIQYRLAICLANQEIFYVPFIF